MQRSPGRGLVVVLLLGAAVAVAAFIFAAVQLGLFRSVTIVPPIASPPAPQTDLDREVLQLRERFESFSSALGLLVAILVAVLAFGGIASASSWFNFERRSESLFRLNVDAQTLASAHADDVFSKSLDTIQLVNSTLELAKEASGRAARVIQERAGEKLQDLERRAQRLLTRAATDDRALVTDARSLAELRGLGLKIEGFENMTYALPEPLKLTPRLRFVRGMAYHLDQQFEDAFAMWDLVVVDPESPPDLRSLAWYWTGYEHNNLGRYDDAATAFGNALQTAAGGRKFELMRIRIESQFFKTPQGESARVVPALERLLEDMSTGRDDDTEARRRRVLTTLGNVRFEVGKDLLGRGNLLEARRAFATAASAFRDAMGATPSPAMYAVLGLGQTLIELGDRDGAAQWFEKARPLVNQEFRDRVEPRTKLLARSCELLCCAYVPRFALEFAGLCPDVEDQLSEVEAPLTVYSIFSHRNVSKATFKEALDEFTRGVLWPSRPVAVDVAHKRARTSGHSRRD